MFLHKARQVSESFCPPFAVCAKDARGLAIPSERPFRVSDRPRASPLSTAVLPLLPMGRLLPSHAPQG
jgi:hypothetical protein